MKKTFTRLDIFALMLALNQLMYAPSLMLMVGHEALHAWPVALTAPFFAATPFIARRSLLAARIWVPFIGIIDTLIAQYAMGYDCGAWAFVLPSLTLAALLLKQRERLWLAGLAALAMTVLVMPVQSVITPDVAASITRINIGSVIILTGFIGCLFAAEK